MAADRIRQQMKKAQEQSKRAARMACRMEPAAAPAAAAASAGNAEDRVADVYWEGPRAIGWRLSVLWPDDQQMYSGKVTAWCRKHNFHLVTYDDGKPLVLSWNCVMQQPKHIYACSRWSHVTMVSPVSSWHNPAAMSGRKPYGPLQCMRAVVPLAAKRCSGIQSWPSSGKRRLPLYPC